MSSANSSAPSSPSYHQQNTSVAVHQVHGMAHTPPSSPIPLIPTSSSPHNGSIAISHSCGHPVHSRLSNSIPHNIPGVVSVVTLPEGILFPIGNFSSMANSSQPMGKQTDSQLYMTIPQNAVVNSKSSITAFRSAKAMASASNLYDMVPIRPGICSSRPLSQSAVSVAESLKPSLGQSVQITPIDHDRFKLIQKTLEAIDSALLQERQVVDKLISVFSRDSFESHTFSEKEVQDDFDEVVKLHKKIEASLINANSRSSFPTEKPAKPLPNLLPSSSDAKPHILSITQQPGDTAIANRYIVPSPAVSIAVSQLPQMGSFFVSVTLAYQGTEEELIRTSDGKQDVLQGLRKQRVDSSGLVVFCKLKIIEVSSKHRHQPFCLIFELEEYTDQGFKQTLARVKSAPFHVQSRPNKRKNSLGPDTPSPKRVCVDGHNRLVESLAECQSADPSCNREFLHKSAPPGSILLKPEGSIDPNADPNYIDITDLLVLPQKEAARYLGISESMLCKRFKEENNKRKWPYRNLRKIDKIVNVLKLHRSDGSISAEDREKLEKLKKDRKDCLKPVKIRISPNDKIPLNRSGIGNLSTHHEGEEGISENEEDDDDDDDDDDDGDNEEKSDEEIPPMVLVTLGNLRSSKDTVPTHDGLASSDSQLGPSGDFSGLKSQTLITEGQMPSLPARKAISGSLRLQTATVPSSLKNPAEDWKKAASKEIRISNAVEIPQELEFNTSSSGGGDAKTEFGEHDDDFEAECFTQKPIEMISSESGTTL